MSGWSLGWKFGWLVGWSIDLLAISWLVGFFVDWLIVDIIVDSLNDIVWLECGLIGYLVCWSISIGVDW